MNNRMDKRRQEKARTICSPSASACILHTAPEFPTTHIFTSHSPSGNFLAVFQTKFKSHNIVSKGPLSSVQPFHLPHPQPPSNHPDTFSASHKPLHFYSCHSHLPLPHTHPMEHGNQTSPQSNSDSATMTLGKELPTTNFSILRCNMGIVIPITIGLL